MKTKYILLFFFIACTMLKMEAQDVYRQSALTKQYISSTKSSSKQQPAVVHSRVGNQNYVNAFIKVSPSIQEQLLTNLGVLIGTKAGDIWTIKVPQEQIEALTNIKPGILAIQLDQPVTASMDAARQKTKVDSVHQGYALPRQYSGQGVVVGILDVGFDYGHPTFYDENGITYRVKKVWEQKTNGTPPAGYAYGHELIGKDDILAQETDAPVESHGSHVAGIAAGSGFGANSDQYKGVAYESDLVFVGITPPQSQWTNTGMTDIVDGINYIFNYAESQGKPAVANLSWGCSIGPHDGTSLFSQAVNNLTGEGKIFTISAGNNGRNFIHLNKQFSSTDSTLLSIVDFNGDLPDKKTWIDVWGQPGETFCIEFELRSGFIPYTSSRYMCIDNSTIDTFLIGSDQDTFFFTMTTVDADINGKPHAFIDLHSKTLNKVSISVKATQGEVHMWMGYVLGTRGYYGRFVSSGIPGASVGDNNMTIGEMACTESAIAVGAYASKTSFVNINTGTVSYDNYVLVDRICPFSSLGPAVDGRIKPDITAPGLTLASAVNSYDQRYSPSGSNASSLVHAYEDNGRTYYYGESSGTSMSAPVTAGIVALLLEEDPSLTPAAIKTMLQQTALKDEYTTQNPDPAIWGYGKIDAYAMMHSLFASSTKEEQNLRTAFCFPNPTTDLIFIKPDGEKLVRITDAQGRQVLQVFTSENKISIRTLPCGMYFVSIFVDGKLLATEKIMKQ